MNADSFLAAVKGKLIVSCQALEDEPLRGAEVMAKMALAAKSAGRRRYAPMDRLTSARSSRWLICP